MQTKTLIQQEANVIKIVNLKVGDAFKQITDEYSSVHTYHGVVIDLLCSGEKTFITILRYKVSYSSISAEILTYSGDTDLNLFPCTIEELQSYLSDAIKSLEKDIIKTKEILQNDIVALEKAREFVSGELSKKLSVMSYKEISYDTYNNQKQER